MKMLSIVETAYDAASFPGIIHRLQRVQNSLARVVTRSTNNSTSALNSPHWLPIRQRIDCKLATPVHPSLHNACPQYFSSLLHAYTRTHQLRSVSSIFSPNLVSTLLSPLVVFAMLAPDPFIWNSLPHHILDLLTLTLGYLQVQSQNSLTLCCKHFWPLSVRFSFDIFVLILALKSYYITFLNFSSACNRR